MTSYLGVCFSVFLENYAMDFSHTLPFSSLYCSQGYKQKSKVCCYFCLATKYKICQNLPVLAPILWPFLWSFLVHFGPFFAHGILRNYGKLTVENWPRDAQRIVVRFGPYQIKQYSLLAMVFAFFLGVISNTDHRHCAFRTFPNIPEHFGSQSSSSSSFVATAFHIRRTITLIVM